MAKRTAIPKDVRDKVLVDAMHRCCLCPEHQEVVDLHHVVQISEGGPNTEDNLMAVCPTCHAKIHRIRNRYTLDQLRMYKERWVQLCAQGLPLDARIAQAFDTTHPPPSITGNQEEERKVVGSRVEPDRELRAHQAAAVCYRRRGGRLEFLLILSSGRRRTFPKGNPKEGEALWAAAEREAKEEAGAIGKLNREALTTFWQFKGRGKGRRQEFAVAAFLLEVDRLLTQHKEGRKPKWYGPEDAEMVLGKKRDSQEAGEFQRVIRLARAEIEGDAAGGVDDTKAT